MDFKQHPFVRTHLLWMGLIFVLWGTSAAAPNAGDIKAAIVNETIWTTLRSQPTIICRTSSNEPLKICRWSRSSIADPHDSTLIFSNPRDRETIQPGYSFYGKGLDKGECGIAIDSVSKVDFAFWNCTLTTDSDHTLSGSTQLLQWVEPYPPAIDKKDAFTDLQYKFGTDNSSNKIDVTCCAEYGKPTPTFTLEIGNRTFKDHSGYKGSEVKDCVTWLDIGFTYLDNSEELRCKIDHVSITEDKRVSFQDAVVLNIEYPPILRALESHSDGVVTLEYDVVGVDITVEARGNPLPELKWNISLSNTSVLDSNDYEIISRNVSKDTVVSTFTLIRESSFLSDGIIELSATNYLGSTKTAYQIELKEVPGNFSRNLIMTLVLAVTALMAAFFIGYFVIKARRRKTRGMLKVPRLPVLSSTVIQNRATGEVAMNDDDEAVSYRVASAGEREHL